MRVYAFCVSCVGPPAVLCCLLLLLVLLLLLLGAKPACAIRGFGWLVKQARPPAHREP